MTDYSVVIPVGPYHEAMAAYAITSVFAQTLPAAVIVVRDSDRRGAGWARNEGLRRVTTPFVVFLDADDTLDPRFLEACRAAWRPGRYVYTDWYEGQAHKAAPRVPWVNRTWHVITTLIPTQYALDIGGFDETLPAAEDTDFYLKLTTGGVCGVHVPQALFTYGPGGQRAKAFVNTPQHTEIMRLFNERYGGKSMGCCGENTSQGPIGERQPGDVEAMALWGGNRAVRGVATGRLYPRTGNGKMAWVDPADVQASPHLWRRTIVEAPPKPESVLGPAPHVTVIEADTDVPALAGVQEIGSFLFPPPLRTAKKAEPVQAKPNVKKARSLYSKGATA